MIYGIGIDIVKIERIRSAAAKWGRKFLSRVFSEQEISYCFSKKDPYYSLSVCFAAKEALIKAIGSEIPVTLTDIAVLHHESGRPVLMVQGRLEEFFRKKSIQCAHVSLSHEREYGVACVVLEEQS